MPTLFEPFERYGDSQQTVSGSQWRKRLSRRTAVKFSVRSVVGKGTTVDIRLPKPDGE